MQLPCLPACSLHRSLPFEDGESNIHIFLFPTFELFSDHSAVILRCATCALVLFFNI